MLLCCGGGGDCLCGVGYSDIFSLFPKNSDIFSSFPKNSDIFSLFPKNKEKMSD